MEKILTETHTKRRGPLAPEPELWEALEGGDGLRRILVDFYSRVFEDERLAPFFAGVTKDWVIQKQWSFLAELFTGEKIYFGDRPKNAHHWMVISHELFDHREDLMRGSLERYGLAPELIERWMAKEEVFRKQIVKTRPRPRKIGGIELPLDDWESLELTTDALCDGCGGCLAVGSVAKAHSFHGTLYHPNCAPAGAGADDGDGR